MTQPQELKLSDRINGRGFAAILTLAVLLRVGAAVYMGDEIETLPGTHDQVSYNNLAIRIAGGHGFSFGSDWWPATGAGEPTAHWSFVYTLLLAGLYGLFGFHPLLVRLLQAVAVGILQPWLSWRLGNRLFGPRAGLAAAAMAACYAYFVYYSAALMTEIFYILAILWALDVATGMIGPRIPLKCADRIRPWLTLGLALGTAALLRQVILLFVPFLLGWIWWESPERRGAVAGSAVTLIVIGLMIAPFTIRNYRAFDQFVLLNTNAGFAFFWGNHPVHGTDFIPILSGENPSYQELIPDDLKGLDEAAMDRALLGRGLGFVFEDPGRYVVLSLSRFKEYFKFWPSSQSEPISNLGRVASFGFFLPFMLAGLCVSILRGIRSRRDSLQVPVPELCMPLYLFIVVYSAIHLLSWSLIRYRLPVDGVLVIFAGLGLVTTADWLKSLRRGWSGERGLAR